MKLFSSKQLFLILIIALNIVVGVIITSIFFHEVDSPGGMVVEAAEAENSGVTLANALDSAIGLQQAYNRVAKKNLPAVVSLQVDTLVVEKRRNSLENEFFHHFFGLPERQRARRGQSYGSGFVISKDGYLVSNYHVVKNAERILVLFKDSDKEYLAEVVGADEDTDVALLKIKTGGNFPFVKLGDSDRVKIGDIVVAIGNPFGLSHTFTTGVISAKGRNEVGQSRYQNFMQTDVAINPGNSGGPLINIRSEVIGVNSMIYSPDRGGNIGIGFAIPINLVKNIVEQLKTNGKVIRGYLGVTLDDISEQMARDLDVDRTGVYVPEVHRDSPAEKGGLRAGDIILSINGKSIKNASSLIHDLGMMSPGTSIGLKVLRGRKAIDLKLTISPQADGGESRGKLSEKLLGVRVKEMSQKLYQAYGERESFGVVVHEVTEDSPLVRKGVRPGDIIRLVNHQETQTVKSFEELVKAGREQSKMIFHIQRGSYLKVIVVYF